MDNLASDDTILLLDRMRDFGTRQLHLAVSQSGEKPFLFYLFRDLQVTEVLLPILQSVFKDWG